MWSSFILSITACLFRDLRTHGHNLRAAFLVPPDPPKTLISLPIVLDAINHHELVLHEGGDIDREVRAFAAPLGLGQDQIEALIASCHTRSFVLGRPMAVPIAILIAQQSDALEYGPQSENSFSKMILGALNSSGNRFGVHLILVTNGFSLCKSTQSAMTRMCRAQSGCASLVLLELPSVEDVEIAVNLAMSETRRALLKSEFGSEAAEKKAIVVVSSATSLLRATNGCRPAAIDSSCGHIGGATDADLGPAGAEGCDVWSAYESLTRASMLDPFVFTAEDASFFVFTAALWRTKDKFSEMSLRELCDLDEACFEINGTAASSIDFKSRFVHSAPESRDGCLVHSDGRCSLFLTGQRTMCPLMMAAEESTSKLSSKQAEYVPVNGHRGTDRSSIVWEHEPKRDDGGALAPDMWGKTPQVSVISGSAREDFSFDITPEEDKFVMYRHEDRIVGPCEDWGTGNGPRVQVLVVHEGGCDFSTAKVFDDVAKVTLALLF